MVFQQHELSEVSKKPLYFYINVKTAEQSRLPLKQQKLQQYEEVEESNLDRPFLKGAHIIQHLLSSPYLSSNLMK